MTSARQAASVRDHGIVVLVDPHGPCFGYLAVAKRKGYGTVVLAGDAESSRAAEGRFHAEPGTGSASHIDAIVECDVASAAAMLEALSPYDGQIAGVLPGNETNVAASLTAGSELGFDCARTEDAVCQQFKTDMKSRLAACGVPSPGFAIARTFEEAEAAWKGFGSDCIVKMVDYRSSANVYRVRSRSELWHAWDAIVSNAFSIEAPFELAKVALVEEFRRGRDLSAEGYECQGAVTFLNFCEKTISHRFVILDHFVPAELSAAERGAIETVGAACVRALGIRNSIFHMELRVTGGDAVVIECASRLPGSTAVLDAIKWSHGDDLIEIGVDLCVGREVTARYKEPRSYFAVSAFHPRESGRLVAVEGREELMRRGGVRSWYLEPQAGDRVRSDGDFRNMYGFVLLEAPTPAGVRAETDWLKENVRLVVSDGHPHSA